MTDLQERLAAALGDRYEVERELGKGGMATVYLAEDRKHSRSVAIKVLQPEVAWATGPDRFLREIEITAGLNHPNILPLYDSGHAEGLVFFVTPYIEGGTLQQRLEEEGQLPLKDARRIILDVADALAHAHKKGIVHRDIKPSNIMLSGSHALVSDFGIARALSYSDGGVLTAAGVQMGTPAYMSPEQASGSEPIDGRADIYSLGCVLHEMLSGEPPFRGETPQALLGKQISEPPPPVRVARPDTPKIVEKTLLSCLKKFPADRLQMADEVIRVLGVEEAWAPSGESAAELEHPGEAPGPDAFKRLKPRTSPLRAGMATLSVAVMTVLAIWALGLLNGRDLDPNRILVFPLSSSEAGDGLAGPGEDVSTIVGYRLEGSEPLVWLEGTDWMDPAGQEDPGLLTFEDKRRIAIDARAGFIIDGSILTVGDSMTVVLRLHDAREGRLVTRSGATALLSTASVVRLGLEAVRPLLPELLGQDRREDILALEDRDPAAIANWLQGERAYRRSEFSEALVHYERALGQDSALALAAVGAAQVHSRLSHLDDAARFASAAMASLELLPLRQQHYAWALDFYVKGVADSADARIAEALSIKPDWSEAWVLRGEINLHLLRHPSVSDSLALAAFRRAHEIDPDYPIPLVHLAEVAIGQGNVEFARSLGRQYEALGADSTFLFRLETELLCAQEGPEGVDWAARTAQNPLQVVLSSVMLASIAMRPACALEGWASVLDNPDATINDHWGAFLGTFSVLSALGRHEEIRQLLTSEWMGAPLNGERLSLLAAAAGMPLDSLADEVFEELRTGLEVRSTPVLWLYGLWVSRKGDWTEIGRASDLAAGIAAETGRRRDLLIADILGAYAELVAGDTAAAVVRFEALEPTGLRNDLMWQPWESLGAERLELAKILLARGDYAGALEWAAWLDHPQPVIFNVYRPESLEIRAEAASRLGISGQADEFRRRREALRFE